MIITLRQHIETKMAIPVHWVAITESDPLPACTLRKSLLDTRHGLQKPNNSAVTGVDLVVYAYDYEEMENLSAGFIEIYDGWLAPLTEGRAKLKIYVDDEDDDVYPSPDGSDNWIYARTISIRVHHRVKG